jgi:hypothetical protein
MSATRKPRKRQKSKNLIPYYPELRKLIPSLGFKSSTKVFSYLKQCNTDFVYDRIYTIEKDIEVNIKSLNMRTSHVSDKIYRGFIFVMDVPDTNAVEIVHCALLTKNTLIRMLKLKAFS